MHSELALKLLSGSSFGAIEKQSSCLYPKHLSSIFFLAIRSALIASFATLEEHPLRVHKRLISPVSCVAYSSFTVPDFPQHQPINLSHIINFPARLTCSLHLLSLFSLLVFLWFVLFGCSQPVVATASPFLPTRADLLARALKTQSATVFKADEIHWSTEPFLHADAGSAARFNWNRLLVCSICEAQQK